MESNFFAKRAVEISSILSSHRRYIHRCAEIGFDNEKTFHYVKKQLENMGIKAKKCGRGGLSAELGDTGSSNVFLLRADMDALPLRENSGEDFASSNGNMHACGHDLHTSMLLGAAQMLKEKEDELPGRVRLMFQPAEETLEGALDMINSGILSNPTPKGALMLHVATGVPFPSGKFIIPDEGIGAPSSDHFSLEVLGKSCHGATPSLGIDATRAAASILTDLFRIAEGEDFEKTVFTVGQFSSGTAANIISDRALIRGTFRALDEAIRNQALAKFAEISQSTASSFGATARFSVERSCPSFLNSKNILKLAKECALKLFGQDSVILQSELSGSTFGGSEDFSYVSQKVPSAVISLTAGDSARGFEYPLHHQKARFDESVLPNGAAFLAFCAASFPQDF